MRTIRKHRDNLFSRLWKELTEEYLPDIGKKPGVYVIAHTAKNLTGTKIKPEHVFYVGIGKGKKGVCQRLKQFWNAINGTQGEHGPGYRFFRDSLCEIPYIKSRSRKKLFVAFIEIKCKADKEIRSPADLERLGHVACLEYYILAHVKDKTGAEPAHNIQ